jgi:signal transduction histidine kinase
VTSSSPQQKTFDELTLGSVHLDELVDKDALVEMVQSFFELFRIPIRVFSEEGQMMADATEQQPLYAYLNTFKNARRALQDVVSAVKNIQPAVNDEVTHPCVSGALYRVMAISYDARRIGRVILGPFLPPEVTELPSALLELEPGINPREARELLQQMPHARLESVGQIAEHLRHTLDLILFSGHKALLTSNMHLASVREGYRELQEKNASLQEAFDRLKELDRLKSNFLATVSHELRTPLTSIIGYSEMLAEGIAGDMTNEQTEFVRTIREKGEQLLDLIKGLLDLSKLESGTMSLRKANIAVAPVIRDVAQTLTPTARKKGVDLDVHVDPALPTLWADAERLRQVLLNLTENAIKFTPETGKVRIAVRPSVMETTADRDGPGMVLLTHRRPAVEIRVADTGIGIPEGERTRVFDAFYQVDSSSTREQGGTGLGLSIVKRLVEGHDGQVRVEDNVPRGTVFVVTIPCSRATLS